MADNVGVYEITADLQASPSSSVEASEKVLGNLNLRREDERELYKMLLVGSATASDLPDEPHDFVGNVTPPSWTQAHAGVNHAFIIPVLSASQHEVSSRNAFCSGTFAIETSAVPASASQFYSKQSRFVKLTYKLSASALLLGSASSENLPSTVECADRSGYDGWFVPGSGSYRCNSIFNPAVFEIDVPEYGKIRDVKVWVDFIHDIRGGPGTASADASNPYWCDGSGDTAKFLKQGLQGVQVALRSPNVDFKYAHPLWNNESVSSFKKWPSASLASPYDEVPELLKNSYLLWAGHACEEDLGFALGSATGSFVDEDISFLNPFKAVTDTTPPYKLLSGTVEQVLFDEKYRITHLLVGRGAILRHARLSGSVFDAYEIVDENLYNSAAPNQAMSIDRDSGEVGIIYMSTTSPVSALNVLNHAASSSVAGWSTSPIHTYYNTNDYPGILYYHIDKLGQSHVVTIASSYPETSFRYGFSQTAASGTWTWGIVDKLALSSYPNGVNGAAIHADSNGVPKVLYYDGNGSVMLATSSSIGWQKSLVDSGTLHNYDASYGSFKFNRAVSMFIDDDDVVHMAYCRYITNASYEARLLMYARSGSDGLKIEHVFPDFKGMTSSGAHQKLNVRVDKFGTPIISFQRMPYSTGLVRFSYCAVSSSCGWQVRPVSFFDLDTGGNTSFSDIDSDGNVHTAFWKADGYAPLTGTFLAVVSSSHRQAAMYHEFDTDIDMRTIFCDSSYNDNPRHLARLYDHASHVSAGDANSFSSDNKFSTDIEFYHRNSTLDLSKYNPLKDYKLVNEQVPYSSPSLNLYESTANFRLRPFLLNDGFLSGTNVPWYKDDTIPEGLIETLGSLTYYCKLRSKGWVTGDYNEFPGPNSYQFGPNDMRPVYPLLDDTYVEKINDCQTSTYKNAIIKNKKIVGYRPGLRGTEVHGKWKLMIGVAGDVDNSTPTAVTVAAHPRAGIWFRQYRLEFTVDTGKGAEHQYPSRKRLYDRPGYVASMPGKRLVQIVSGSAAWDTGINYVYSEQKDDYGRSIGITDTTSSFYDSFAVFSRITGSMYDRLVLTGSDVFETYIKNEFKTPYIPISSGSGISPSFDVFDPAMMKAARDVVNNVMRPKTLVNQQNTLKSHVSRSGCIKSTRDLIVEKVNSADAEAKEATNPTTIQINTLKTPLLIK